MNKVIVILGFLVLVPLAAAKAQPPAVSGVVGITGGDPVTVTNDMIFPTGCDATPALGFGDGDTGFCENSDDVVWFVVAGGVELFFDSNGLKTPNTSGPGFINEPSSSTNPTLVPNLNEPDGFDEGIGGVAGEVSIITGSVEALTVDSNQVVTINSGNLVLAELFAQSVTAGITASAIQTQGQGVMTTTINQVSTVGTEDDVVTLTAAVAGIGQEVFNDGTNTLQIFPSSGDDIGNGLNVSTRLEPNESVTFYAFDSTNWATVAKTQTPHAEFEDANNTDAFAVTAANNAEAYHSNGIVAGDLIGWTFDPGGAGTSFPIVSIADAGGGDITVTTTGSHTLAVGAIISQAGLSDAAYEGLFQVLTVPLATTYTVTAVFTATDTGTMQEGATLTALGSAAGAYFFSWSLSSTSPNSDETMDFQLCNNVVAVGPLTRWSTLSNNSFGSVSGSGILPSVSGGDKISLYVLNSSSDSDITVRNIALSLIRL